MIGLLTGVLGFGGLGLRLFLFLGSKIFSGASIARRRLSADTENMWGFLGVAAKPKTQEVALEMAHRQALMQGSWFSPVRFYIMILLAVFIWGVWGNFMRVPGLKLEIAQLKDHMKNDSCVDDDERHICQQLFATMALNARFQAANKAWEQANTNLKNAYEEKLRGLSRTIQAENGRANIANARIKRANDEAAKIIAGADLKPDDYRSFVRDLVKTESVTESGSGSGSPSSPTGDVQPGMLHGAGPVQPTGDEPGASPDPSAESKTPDAG